MLAQNAALDGSGDCSGHDHARKHGLVEVADDLFQSKGDGGNGSIERRGNAGCDAHRSHSALALT